MSPCSVPSDEELSQHDSLSDWEEEPSKFTCLLCPLVSLCFESALQHLQTFHDFNLPKLLKDLDFYDRIKLINYTRTLILMDKQPTEQCLLSDTTWKKGETYLKPVIEDDPFLFDLDPIYSNNETELNELQGLNEKDKYIFLLEEQLKSMKIYVDENILSIPKQEQRISVKEMNELSLIKEEGWEMDYYFGGYAQADIHEQMIKDTVRTDSYRDFIYQNKSLFKDKIVLDVGCGTGILSLFAAKAGASLVLAVDNSTVIKKAKEITYVNGLDHIVKFVAGKIEDVVLPVEKVDIIISEWMGYFLLYEAMLDSVLYARTKYLSPNGIMCPSNSFITLSAFSDEDYMNDRIHFWNDVYGFNFKTMNETMFKQGQVDYISKDSLVSDSVIVKSINIQTDTVESLDFQQDFTLQINKKVNILLLILNGFNAWIMWIL